MLFVPAHVLLILEGRKTQTRRFWRKAHPMVKIGGDYWAQTRLFDKASRFARIQVTNLDWIPLDPVPIEDARAEGYDSVEAFQAALMRINGLAWWPQREMVWRVVFRVSSAQTSESTRLAR